MAATERDLAALAAAVARRRRPLSGAAAIGLKVGAVLDRHKMAKHFELTISDDRFSFARKTREITAEAAFDGLYVVRTSLPAATLDDVGTVRAYKSLALVERAFRCLKTVDLQIRPIYHWLADRVRAHVFLCMLAYYVEWHLRARLAPMLYDDADQGGRRGGPRQHRRQGRALTLGDRQADHRPHPGRPAGAQLGEPARRSGHAHPQHHAQRARARAPLHPHGPPDTDPKQGLRPPRSTPRPYPVAILAFEAISRQIKRLRPLKEGSSG